MRTVPWKEASYLEILKAPQCLRRNIASLAQPRQQVKAALSIARRTRPGHLFHSLCSAGEKEMLGGQLLLAQARAAFDINLKYQMCVDGRDVRKRFGMAYLIGG